jgi:DNA-binding NarL/FixJ family response regulator
VPLLGRYLNSETEVERIARLCKKAASEHVERSCPATARGPARLTKQQNAEIVALYEAGYGPAKIAREIGTTEWTVHHRLNRIGVERRPRGMTEQQCQEAVRSYKAGESMTRISLKLGFNDKTIKKAIVHAGVTIRPSARHPRD